MTVYQAGVFQPDAFQLLYVVSGDVTAPAAISAPPRYTPAQPRGPHAAAEPRGPYTPAEPREEVAA